MFHRRGDVAGESEAVVPSRCLILSRARVPKMRLMVLFRHGTAWCVASVA